MSDYVVHKFPVDDGCDQHVYLPTGAKVLTVQHQRGAACLWAAVPVGAKTSEGRYFASRGTGWQADDYMELDYISTSQRDDGLVFHYFIAPEPTP